MTSTVPLRIVTVFPAVVELKKQVKTRSFCKVVLTVTVAELPTVVPTVAAEFKAYSLKGAVAAVAGLNLIEPCASTVPEDPVVKQVMRAS